MTIINGIEIDYISNTYNEIKNAILNNDPIEEKLNVIIVISNPCQYARRYILAKEFIKRMENENNVELYIVELIYNKQKFIITDSKNKNHLQLSTNTAPLWHKENMINLGINKLLPKNWKAVAWIDADIEFESTDWAINTLKILNGSKDIVQLFSHAIDMDMNEDAMSIFSSFGFQYSKNRNYKNNNSINFWHPGFAWACNRKTYDKMGGLYENSILGSGDHNMSLSLIGNAYKSVNRDVNSDYLNNVLDFERKNKNLRLGYVPGVIRHYYHGSKKNRKYHERWQILVNNNYSPLIHITKDKNGLLIPTEKCPKKLLDDIYNYFLERNEDEGLSKI